MAGTPAQRLRELLAQPKVEIMPGCYDALSAKLVADAGYKVTFMSGFADHPIRSRGDFLFRSVR